MNICLLWSINIGSQKHFPSNSHKQLTEPMMTQLIDDQ